MLKRKIAALLTALAVSVSMTGCFGIFDDGFSFETEESRGHTHSSNRKDDNSSKDDDNKDDNFDNDNKDGMENSSQLPDNSSTRMSMSDGNLVINRRTREHEQKMGDKGWTILLYLCGTDLESNAGAATYDLIEAIEAQYNKDVRLIVQTGGTQTWNNGAMSSDRIQRWENVEGDIELVQELADASMGDPSTLSDFVAWGVENYPAQYMGLVLWNHGGGSISGVCFDENDRYNSLSLRELDSALNSVYDKMTDRFEFIGFDACLMSTLETANILVPYARYMFASEETEPGGGWNYTDIMNYLAKNPSANGAELGRMQCESYYQHCKDYGSSDGATFSITDLSKIDALISAFNDTAKEMYQSNKLNDISRACFGADNFGGNNRSDGYTNMVDLKGILENVKSYAPSASRALKALDEAIVCDVTGPQHRGAGGLAVYYPLCVQGSEELSIFRDICTSTYYLAFVDKVAYGTTGGLVTAYDNSELVSDSDDIWDNSFAFSDNIGSNDGEFEQINDGCALSLIAEGIDDDGNYLIQLSDFDALCVAACSVFIIDTDGSYIYIGEDDDVIIDYDNCIIYDDFDGTWVCMDGIVMPIELVSQNDVISVYTCSILLNGEPTNLRIEYDWDYGEWSVIGAWDGIDPDTGMAARDIVKLQNGDVIAPIYYYVDNYGEDYFYGHEYVVNGEIKLKYDDLPAADYYYSFVLYDVYGNVWYTDGVTFNIDENGDLWYYTE